MSRAARADLEVLAVEEQRRGFLAYDLLTGRVTHDHPLFTWLLRNGAGPNELRDLAKQQIPLDVLGLNFYPQWSTQQVSVGRNGRLRFRPVEQDGAGFATLIEAYQKRYDAPVIITETSARGSVEVREHWLETSVAAIRSLRERGVPVLGYTWFPMFTMIDWKYRFGRRPLKDYRLDLGLFGIDSWDGAVDAGNRWKATPLVDHFRRLVDDPAGSVGELAPAAQLEMVSA